MRRLLLALLLLLPTPVLANEVECTQAAYLAELARINACSNYTGDCNLAGRTITFNCTNTTIYFDDNPETGGNADGCIPAVANAECNAANDPYQCCTGNGTGTCCTGDKDDWRITADDVTIDGESNNITFKLDPPCDRNVGETGCTEFEDSNYVLRIAGDDVTIKNLTLSHFLKTIYAEGHGALIDNVTIIRPCDSAFFTDPDVTSDDPDSTNVMQNSLVTKGCDKCLNLQGHDLPDGSWQYPNYDSIIRNNTFATCRIAVKGLEGRHLLEGNSFSVADDHPFTDPSQAFQVGKEGSSSYTAVVYWRDNVIDGFKYGFTVEGAGSLVSLGDNLVKNCRFVGGTFDNNSRGLIENDIFQDNGGSNSSLDNEGGVVVRETFVGEIDLGGGGVTIDGRSFTSEGGNQFLSNLDGDDNPRDVGNLTSPVLKAENNWWGGDTDPSDKVLGNVDYTPVAGDDTSGGDPPPQVANVRRTDVYAD